MCLAANILSALSWSWPALLFFRIFLGAGMGINSSTVSVYAAECAPSPIRGGLAVSWQMFTAFGIFVGFITNVAVYNVRYTTLINCFFSDILRLDLILGDGNLQLRFFQLCHFSGCSISVPSLQLGISKRAPSTRRHSDHYGGFVTQSFRRPRSSIPCISQDN